MVCDEIFEDQVDHSLEGGSSVLQTKGHNFTTVYPLIGDEGCLVLIWQVHLDMVVSKVSIYKAE